MQNKAKLQKPQISLTPVRIRDYEKKTLSERGKNKPKTNPKQTQTKPKQTQNKAKQIEDPEGTQTKPKQIEDPEGSQFQGKQFMPRVDPCCD